MDTRGLLRHAGVTTAVVAVSALVGLGAVWARTAAYQAESPPNCYGIGWGCSPDPATTAFLMGFMVVVPTVLVVGITLGAGLLIAKARPRAIPWVRGWSLLVRVVAGGVGLLAAVSAGVEIVG